MVTKLHTPEVKTAGHRFSFVSNKIDKSPREMSFHSRRDILSTFTGNPSKSASTINLFESLRNQVQETASSSFSGVSKACKLHMLSPYERYLKSKEDELKSKTEEVMEKKGELVKITDRIKPVFLASVLLLIMNFVITLSE